MILRHRIYRALVSALLVLGALTAAAMPAGAAMMPSIPGIPDCKAEPPITAANYGAAGGLDSGPATPGTGDPFAANSTTTAYAVYGWGGLNWFDYDPGCGPSAVTDTQSAGSGVLAGIVWGSLVQATALTTTIQRIAFDPNTISVLNPIVTLASEAFGNRVFMLLFFAAMLGMGVYIVTKFGPKGDVRSAASKAGWLGLMLMFGIVTTVWPLKIAPAIDGAVTGAVSTVNAAVAQSTGVADSLPDATAGNVQRSVLYESWKAGMFGRFQGATADKYGPKLFAAGAVSWADLKDLEANPTKRAAFYEAKRLLWREAAAEVESADPEAYAYIAGHRNTDRLGYASMAWLGFWATEPFTTLASLLLLVALVIVRLVLIVGPLLAVVAVVPKGQAMLRKIFDYFIGCVITALLYGGVAAVMTAAVGGMLSPKSGTNPLIATLMLILLTFVLWRFLNPWKALKHVTMTEGKGKELRKRMDERRARRGPKGRRTLRHPFARRTRAPQGATPQDAPMTAVQDATPAEARTRPVKQPRVDKKAALTGAVVGGAKGFAVAGWAGAAKGAVTGGAKATATSSAKRGVVRASGRLPAQKPAQPRAISATAAKVTARTTRRGPGRHRPAGPSAPNRTRASGSASSAPRANGQARIYVPGQQSPADNLTPATRRADGSFGIFVPAGRKGSTS